MRVAILMSTYNGEKYLQEQMDSLLRQIGVSVEIFVRDDGSTDGTIDILKHYLKKNPNIQLKLGKNVGVGNSFMSLVSSVPDDFDYYAFSDQDDIWLDNKLSKAIEMIGENKRSTLYCSNQILVNSIGERCGIRFKLKPDCSVEQCFQTNHVTGCTMVWNNSLHAILSNKSNLPTSSLLENRIHDVWVSSVAGLVGDVYCDEYAYILYRQHDNNVVGAADDTFLDTLRLQLKKLRNPEMRRGRSKLAKELVERFPNESMKHPLVRLASNAESIHGKLKIIQNSSEFRMYTKEAEISFVIKVLSGMF